MIIILLPKTLIKFEAFKIAIQDGDLHFLSDNPFSYDLFFIYLLVHKISIFYFNKIIYRFISITKNYQFDKQNKFCVINKNIRLQFLHWTQVHMKNNRNLIEKISIKDDVISKTVSK